MRRAVTTVVFTIAGLSFAFGFSNGWAVGRALGVPAWGSPLVAPAVDLSVATLLASIQFLRAHGVGGRLIGPRALLATCGLMTFALNTVRPILLGQIGRACFDAIAPTLLIGWGEVGPRLLALLYVAAPRAADESVHESELVPMLEAGSGPDPRLVVRARELDAARRAEVGRPISRDRLRAALGVSNTLASELVRIVRSPAQDGDAE